MSANDGDIGFFFFDIFILNCHVLKKEPILECQLTCLGTSVDFKSVLRSKFTSFLKQQNSIDITVHTFCFKWDHNEFLSFRGLVPSYPVLNFIQNFIILIQNTL